jgi:peptidoglycan/xylan/chitin deacetylase (PgdA/CDA1 family)
MTMLKVALTHDIDRIDKTYQYFTRTLKSILKKDFKIAFNNLSSIFRKENPYWGFDEMIRIENQFNVKSTNYFLNEKIKVEFFNPKNWTLSIGRYNIYDPRIINIMKYLDANGWEVGLHGSYNSYVNPEMLQEEKKTLEEILGHKVIGIRQHYLNITPNTWELQKKIGLKYDSSWGLTKEIGFKEERIKHFFPFGDDFMVIPMVIMDTPFLATKDPYLKLKQIISKCIEKQAILVINWHNNYFSRSEFPEYIEAYIRIIEECKKCNARFYTMDEYYNEEMLENKKNK